MATIKKILDVSAEEIVEMIERKFNIKAKFVEHSANGIVRMEVE